MTSQEWVGFAKGTIALLVLGFAVRLIVGGFAGGMERRERANGMDR